jgi:hypothetical protein
LLALGGAAFALTGVAYAAIPSVDGTIHACYSNQTGALRVVDAEAVGGGRCADTETALTWNQEGPVGPVGAPGPTGPAGGFKGARRVKAFGLFTDATSKTVTVECGPGEIATGGGHQLLGAYDGRVITRSFPVGGSTPTAWQVKARAPAALGNWRVRAWAVCAH